MSLNGHRSLAHGDHTEITLSLSFEISSEHQAPPFLNSNKMFDDWWQNGQTLFGQIFSSSI